MAATPWTTLTALLGIALGVASTVAVHLVSLAVSDSLQAARPPHLRGVTHIAELPGGGMQDYFELRRRWRQQQRSHILGLPDGEELPAAGRQQAPQGPPAQEEAAPDWLREVDFMTPVVEGRLAAEGRRLQVVGADWLGGAAPPEVAAMRRAVMADSSLGLGVDEVLELRGERWTVARVLDAGLSNGLFADIGNAAALLRLSPDALSFVALRLQDPWAGLRTWLERLLPGLSAGLPAAVERLPATAPGTLPSWRLQPVAAILPEQQFAKAILFNLGALGMLALLVAWFLIYQVCVLWLRRQETLMLRLQAIGFSAAELAGGFVLSSAALGALATLVGIFGGYGLAALLVRVSTAGFDALPAVGMSAIVVAKGLVSGIGVASAGAWLAFAKRGKAARTNRASSLARRCVAPPWRGIGLGAALAAVGIGFDETGLYGGFAAILAAGLIAAFLAAPLLRLLRRWLRRASPNLLTRLALREATWFEEDLSAALGALILAVGASIGVALMVDSFERDFAKMLAQRLGHDFFLQLPNQEGERLAAALRTAHPAALVQAYGRISTRLQGQAVEVGYTDFSAAESARYGYPRALAEDEAFASESLLAKLGLAVGDAIGSGAPLRIVHEFSGFGEATPRLLMNAQAAARRFGALGFDRISLSGIDAAALDRRLQDWAPGVEVLQRAAMRKTALEIFDRTFAITRALTLLALIIAVVGLYNAMTALRLGQRASASLLCALGLNPAEQRRMALIRGGVLGGSAVVLALPLGWFIGFTLCQAINPRAFGWSIELAASLEAWAWPTLLGLAAAVAASLMPTPGEKGPAA